MDGKSVAGKVTEHVSSTVKTLKEKGVEPYLATVLVGNDEASATYVRNKHRACEQVGIRTINHHLPEDYSTNQLIELITILNEDRRVHGILVQLPLPRHINEFLITSMIKPSKDVDCLTPFNIGLLAYDVAKLLPCTPAGIVELMKHYRIDPAGKHVTIVNRSVLVGKPLGTMLLHLDATVTICHSKTANIREMCREADILVTAVGDRSRFVLTADMVKDGAVVIDVGIDRVNGRLVGDADSSVMEKASYMTPVPGGVGPMTVAMLLRNTVIAAALNEGIDVD
ncbi:MAG: bifunctional 5,10-methylene-tetrahydrofolate dehydrogenase/5,10-methylene-tetrahydrofolate cyclohydrolase [Candidatus Nitrosocaldus sp.]|nr:bifunctional 5,10-methylene-tetrahydrofolate dehydrogenase/5,10-methylene-tetrahydrofolate cyclohydrolase [Candidatus Nitrosocaldus sp.]